MVVRGSVPVHSAGNTKHGRAAGQSFVSFQRFARLSVVLWNGITLLFPRSTGIGVAAPLLVRAA